MEPFPSVPDLFSIEGGGGGGRGGRGGARQGRLKA